MGKLSKLWIVTAVIAASLAIGFGVLAWLLYLRTERGVVEAHRRDQQLLARLAATAFQQRLDAHRHGVESLAGALAGQREERFSQTLASLPLPEGATRVMLLRANTLEVQPPADDLAALKATALPWLGQTRPVVTDPVALDSAAREIIVLVPGVSSESTLQVGAAFPFRPLFAEAFPDGVSTHLSLSLLNEQGLVLVNTRHPEMAGRRLPPPGGQCLPCHTGFALEHGMMRGEEGNGQLQVQGSPLALLVFTPVTVPGRRWSLALSEPYSAITADTRQGFRAISLLLGFSLLVGVLATVVTAQYHAQRRRAEERARLAERRARMERQLLQNQQLAAIGRMTSQIAHEINTPLAALGLNVSYLQAEVTRRLGGDSPEIEEVSQAIAGEIARLKRVVGDYLRVARLPQAVPVEASLREALESYLDFIQPEAQARGVRLEVDLGSGPAIVLLDADLFRQAFLNLVQNSLEAMTAGGTLRVTLAAESGEQLVCVADTGPGIPPEALPYIFEPFFTTKKEGTGLGLAHARRVIEQHNGSIDCRSAPGQGTLFRVRLPALAPAPRAGERMVHHDNV